MGKEKQIISVPDSNLEMYADPSGYLFGSEALELIKFVPQKKYVRAADLGAGDGILSILAAQKLNIPEIWAVELDSDAGKLAVDNAALNKLTGIIKVHKGDIRALKGVFQRGTFDLVLANPPFFPLGQDHQSLSERESAARQESNGKLIHFLQAARYLLRKGSDLVILYHPSRLDLLIHEIGRAGFCVKELQFLHHKNGKALFLLARAVPGAGPGIHIRPPITLKESIKHKMIEQLRNPISKEE